MSIVIAASVALLLQGDVELESGPGESDSASGGGSEKTADPANDGATPDAPTEEKKVLSAPVLPSVLLKGDTSKEGEIRAGLTIPFAVGASHHALLLPQFNAKAKYGTADLITAGPSGRSLGEWNGGIQVAFHIEPYSTKPSSADQAGLAKAKRIVAQGCVADCGTSNADKRFCSDVEPKLTKQESQSVEKKEKEIAALKGELESSRKLVDQLRGKIETRARQAEEEVIEARQAHLVSLQKAADAPEAERRKSQADVLEASIRLAQAEMAYLRESEGHYSEREELSALSTGIKENEEAIAGLEKEVADLNAKAQGFDPRAVEPCESGAVILTALERPYVKRSANSAPLVLSFGARAGGRSHRFVKGTPRPTGSEDDRIELPPYEEGTNSAFVGAVAGGAGWIVPGKLSRPATWFFEAVGAYEYGETAQDTTAEWCAPLDEDPEDAEVDGKKFDGAGERCSDAPFGRPTEAGVAHLGAWGGVVEAESGYWRAGLGVRWIRQRQYSGEKHKKHDVGVELPLYFNALRARGKAKSSLSYKGLVRVMPRVSWIIRPDGPEDEAKTEIAFVLSVSLLAQRSVFLYPLDWI